MATPASSSSSDKMSITSSRGSSPIISPNRQLSKITVLTQKYEDKLFTNLTKLKTKLSEKHYSQYNHVNDLIIILNKILNSNTIYYQDFEKLEKLVTIFFVQFSDNTVIKLKEIWHDVCVTIVFINSFFENFEDFKLISETNIVYHTRGLANMFSKIPTKYRLNENESYELQGILEHHNPRGLRIISRQHKPEAIYAELVSPSKKIVSPKFYTLSVVNSDIKPPIGNISSGRSLGRSFGRSLRNFLHTDKREKDAIAATGGFKKNFIKNIKKLTSDLNII